MSDEAYGFRVEWFDNRSELTREYFLSYFPSNDTLQLSETKNGHSRIFLKRSQVAGVTLDRLFIGGTIVAHARQLKILDYANEWTRKRLAMNKQRAVLVLSSKAGLDIGTLLQQAGQAGLALTELRSGTIDASAEKFGEHSAAISAGPCVAVCLVGPDAIKTATELQGGDPNIYVLNPLSGCDFLKELFGSGKSMKTNAKRGPGCSCCVIKPHAVSEGRTGDIMRAITEAGFTINAMQLFNLERPAAQEFLEVYDGVVKEYNDLVLQLISGPLVALEITGEGDNVVQNFRELTGPHDPIVAKHIRGNTLRARFGADRVQNAVHCTDLPDDGPLECQYFFDILQ